MLEQIKRDSHATFLLFSLCVSLAVNADTPFSLAFSGVRVCGGQAHVVKTVAAHTDVGCRLLGQAETFAIGNATRW